jgi:hypothetical protein
MTLRKTTIRSVLALVLIAGSGGTAAFAQTVRVTAPEENFRKEPRVTGSNRLATVFEGAILDLEARQGRWIRATLEGWIWTPSVSSTDRDGFDLIVSNPGGENLRESPDGEARRVARLLRGMLLDQVDTQGNWTRVQRTAWVWAESVIDVSGGTPAAAALPAEPSGSALSEIESERAPSPTDLPDRIVVTESEVGLHVSPSGDTLAVLRPSADLEVVSRQGSWARVRLEGWVWVPSTMPADSALASEALTAADVLANPDQYRGRRVRWRLQFVSVERAEPARVDFYEGEPFILARAADGEQGFVYVAVPPELLPAAEALRPLQVIEVFGRIRTGRSALMGRPVIDLIALD